MFSCYLLECQSSKGNKSYIGYTKTSTLAKRLNQHNGILKGGAKSVRGHFCRHRCIVHGFPTKGAAMSFEYKWKNTCYGLEKRLQCIDTLVKTFLSPLKVELKC